MDKKDLYEVLPQLYMIADEELRDKCAEAYLLGVALGNWDNKGGLVNCPVNVGALRDYCPVTNLEHVRVATAAAARVYDYLSPWLKEIGAVCDRDTVIAGTLLHDIGKMIEYDRDDTNRACYSRTGPMFRHTVAGAYLAKKGGLPDEIVHIVLTHSHSQAPEGPNALETPATTIVKGCDLMSWESIELKWHK